MNSNSFLAKKSIAIIGEIKVSADKSISHRSLIFLALANGEAEIDNLLESEDVLNTAKALQKMGVSIEKKQNSRYHVIGLGLCGLQEPKSYIDCGNSGTSARLLMGLVSAFDFRSFFIGDESLQQRPMKRVIEPLSEMGVEFSSRKNGLLPISILGSSKLLPISYKMTIASAQVKSAILLAAMNTKGRTEIFEPNPSRDHTENMMKFFDIDVDISSENGLKKISYNGLQEFDAKDLSVPNDISSAAFWIVAALIIKDSNITLKNICINPLRSGILEVLIKMRGNIQIYNKRNLCGEEVADIKVAYSNLKGIEIGSEIAPRMIDEYPILSIAAAHAEGQTAMNGLGELKFKESNRFQAINDILNKVGVSCKSNQNSITINGGFDQPQKNIQITANLDHRIAMSALIMGLTLDNGITIDDYKVIDTSFPNFIKILKKFNK
jgi:3-phosphoshikimate 1-carboxyvinyltransferase